MKETLKAPIIIVGFMAALALRIWATGGGRLWWYAYLGLVLLLFASWGISWLLTPKWVRSLSTTDAGRAGRVE